MLRNAGLKKPFCVSEELMKMTATQFRGGAPSTGLKTRTGDHSSICNRERVISSLHQNKARTFAALSNRKDLGDANVVGECNLSSTHRPMYSRLVTHRRRTRFPVVFNQLSSDFGVGCSEVEEKVILEEVHPLPTAASDELMNDNEVNDTPIHEAHTPNVKRELLMLSLPAMVGQAIDPIAMLMETAYIGRLGSVQLASAGVSMNIFNYISKLFNIPLLSVATSFVAEDIAKNASLPSTTENVYEDIANGKSVPAERKQLSSVSTALLLAFGIGMFEAIALSLGSGIFLKMMGISSNSSMYIRAKRFLSIRAIGAPAVVASLALQGVFRGFKDTQTRVMSRYTVTFFMIWFLNKKAVLLPPKMGLLQFGGYIKSGGFLLGRTLAVLTTMTLGTSMAARQGPVAMAAHQICIQVWLAVSLLTDALATSGQALIASYSSKGEYKVVKEITDFMLKIGLFIGVTLAVILGTSFSSLATIFTKDVAVLEILRSGVLFVSASQPLTSLAYTFDGLHYGVSDFAYAARAMMIVGAISSAFLLYAPSVIGLSGVWLGLTLFMGLRTIAGFVRLSSKSGPWWFLHRDTRTSQG